jgi:hypothetical protein
MTIYEQIKEALINKEGSNISSTFVKKELKEKFGTNPSSVLISDYCFNRTNDGINFEIHPHLFEFKERNQYIYLGEKHKYSGKIYHKPIHGKLKEYGEWENGKLIIY